MIEANKHQNEIFGKYTPVVVSLQPNFAPLCAQSSSREPAVGLHRGVLRQRLGLPLHRLRLHALSKAKADARTGWSSQRIRTDAKLGPEGAQSQTYLEKGKIRCAFVQSRAY